MRIRQLLTLGLLGLFFYSSSAQTTIEMEEDAGVYKVPCKVNGLKLKFIFDTGASNVSLSSTVADMMLENEYLSKDDIIGSGYSQTADGGIVDHTKIRLKTIEIGGQILKNVEAVVIHGQSAPLLLGQSAIQKLGKVSISGNKLIITNNEATNPYIKNEQISYDDIFIIDARANKYYRNGDYLLAVEDFEKLRFNTEEPLLLDLSPELFYSSVYAYASSLSSINRYEDALDIFLKYEDKVISMLGFLKEKYISQICLTAYFAENYDMSIRYGRMAKSLYTYPSSTNWYTTYWIASSYEKKGDQNKAHNEIISFINEYLRFMDISATDCWNKEYTDPFLANAYNSLAWKYPSLDQAKKYLIIAAAWGDKDAIESCNKYNLDYSVKPSDYVY